MGKLDGGRNAPAISLNNKKGENFQKNIIKPKTLNLFLIFVTFVTWKHAKLTGF